MPDRSRPLPVQASLRYLKLQAKRRLATGEFPTLHDAQVAIAREHGHSSWAALKQAVDDPPERQSHALDQVRWVIARFRGAREPGWTAPGDDELREHFDEKFLALVPPAELISSITAVAADLGEELVVTNLAPLTLRARIAGLDAFASVGPDPPHRLTALAGVPLGERITDDRITASPPSRALGDVPGWAAELAETVAGELGLVGLVLGGGSPAAPAWAITKGWADLDRAEVLETGHRFPASGISALVTAAAVLRLVAEGHVGLDAPANDYLRTVRLADDTVTVRDLLASTGGVDSPDPRVLTAESVPDLVTVTGPVIACSGPRGVVRASNGGYAALGQLLADVTGLPFAEAAGGLVLEPLGMSDSSFPASLAGIALQAVTCYQLTPDGAFVPVPAALCTIPAAGGLWATAADVLRLGTGWSSLLPNALARDALEAELGWFLSPRRDIAMTGGALPGSTAFLLQRVRDRQVQLTITTRFMVLDRILDRVLRAWAQTAR
jgi:CubicO group peptidase (beta-lactamase class C family)